MIAADHIHPMLVHFPIVLLLLLAGLDAAGWLGGWDMGERSVLGNVSCVLAVLTGVAAIATYFAGDIAVNIALRKGFPEALVETHETLGTITALLLALWGFLRLVLRGRRTATRGITRGLVVGGEIALSILIIVTAYFGGNLVYRHGVNVVGVSPSAAAAADNGGNAGSSASDSGID